MTDILSVHGLTKSFGAIPVATDVNFTVSVSVWPAGRAEPSLSVVVATN